MLSIILWAIAIPLAWRAERAYQQMDELMPEGISIALPVLSVIIPARNEAKVLPALLQSLKEQNYPSDIETIVVDDNSQDETAKVADSFGVIMVRLTELPPGWLGKPHACQRGAESATGDWLLFTDADTVHGPEAASSAVNFVIRNNLDGLSLFLKQISSGWYDAVALGTAFTGLFAGWGAMTNMFNGQFILVKRSVFESSGGFAAVRQYVLEDVAFGLHLQSLGYQAPVLRGEALASVHMYRGFAQLWHGLTRLESGTMTRSVSSMLLMIIFIAQIATPLIYYAQAVLGKILWVYPILAWLVAMLMVLPWMHRIRSAALVVFSPFGAVFIILGAL